MFHNRRFVLTGSPNPCALSDASKSHTFTSHKLTTIFVNYITDLYKTKHTMHSVGTNLSSWRHCPPCWPCRVRQNVQTVKCISHSLQASVLDRSLVFSAWNGILNQVSGVHSMVKSSLRIYQQRENVNPIPGSNCIHIIRFYFYIDLKRWIPLRVHFI